MNYKQLVQITLKLKYNYQPEKLTPSQNFNLKPKPYCETLYYQRERRRSVLEWVFGSIIAMFYFMHVQGMEFIYLPWCQPSEPTQL